MAITLGTPTIHGSDAIEDFDHTVESGDDRLLFVVATFRDGDVSGANYNGVAMTEMFSVNAPNSGNGQPGLRAFRLVNPPVGNHSVNISSTGNSHGLMAVALFGVDQTTPHGTATTQFESSNSAVAIEITVDSTDSLVIDCGRIGATTSPTATEGTGQTVVALGSAHSARGTIFMSSKPAGDPTTTMSWTWDSGTRAVQGGVEFNPADEGDGSVTGEAAQTLPAITQSAEGEAVNPVTGEVAQTLPALGQSAEGTVAESVTGEVAQTLPAITQSAAGEHTAPEEDGPILAFQTSAGDPILAFQTGQAEEADNFGPISQTLPALIQSAVGTVADPVTGEIVQTLPAITQNAGGTVADGVSGLVAQILPALTQSAEGTSLDAVTGAAAQTLPALVQSASGTSFVNVTGEAASLLAALVQNAAGLVAEDVTGTIAQTLPALTQQARGPVPPEVTPGAVSVTFSTGKRGPLKHRPIVLWDAEAGQEVVFRLVNDNVVLVPYTNPNQWVERYPPFTGPAIKADNGKLYFIHAVDGEIVPERATVTVRTRPVYFSDVNEPKGDATFYELVLLS